MFDQTCFINSMYQCTKFIITLSVLQSILKGDYLTYERMKSALNAMAGTDEFKDVIPTFADFHLQMEWAEVGNRSNLSLLLQQWADLIDVLVLCDVCFLPNSTFITLCHIQSHQFF